MRDLQHCNRARAPGNNLVENTSNYKLKPIYRQGKGKEKGKWKSLKGKVKRKMQGKGKRKGMKR